MFSSNCALKWGVSACVDDLQDGFVQVPAALNLSSIFRRRGTSMLKYWSLSSDGLSRNQGMCWNITMCWQLCSLASLSSCSNQASWSLTNVGIWERWKQNHQSTEAFLDFAAVSRQVVLTKIHIEWRLIRSVNSRKEIAWEEMTLVDTVKASDALVINCWPPTGNGYLCRENNSALQARNTRLFRVFLFDTLFAFLFHKRKPN